MSDSEFQEHHEGDDLSTYLLNFAEAAIRKSTDTPEKLESSLAWHVRALAHDHAREPTGSTLHSLRDFQKLLESVRGTKGTLGSQEELIIIHAKLCADRFGIPYTREKLHDILFEEFPDEELVGQTFDRLWSHIEGTGEREDS